MENKTGVIIGRFQVPYLHLGHIYLISHALQKYNHVVILLGSLPNGKIDDRNPFDFHFRVQNINTIFNPGRTSIYKLTDVPGDDAKWSDNIDWLLEDFLNPVLLHSRDSFKDHYMGKHSTVEVPELPGYSGTNLRQSLSMENSDKRISRGEDGWG